MVAVGVGNNGVAAKLNEIRSTYDFIYFVLTFCVGCELYALQGMSTFNKKM